MRQTTGKSENENGPKNGAQKRTVRSEAIFAAGKRSGNTKQYVDMVEWNDRSLLSGQKSDNWKTEKLELRNQEKMTITGKNIFRQKK